MKAAKLRREDNFIDEIVDTLKSVPKTRLRIVLDVVGALAVRENSGKGPKPKGRKSLLKTPFCGIWQGRTDMSNGQSYAKSLRKSLESRGDRN